MKRNKSVREAYEKRKESGREAEEKRKRLNGQETIFIVSQKEQKEQKCQPPGD